MLSFGQGQLLTITMTSKSQMDMDPNSSIHVCILSTAVLFLIVLIKHYQDHDVWASAFDQPHYAQIFEEDSRGRYPQ